MATLREPFALDRSLNTTESPSRNIADVLAEELSAMITAIGGLNFINFVVVAELPTTGISTTTIYLVPSDDPQSENTYDEYINLNGTISGWEKIGSTDIDLSGYYTSAEVDDLLADKADVSDIPTVNDGTLTIQQNGDTKGTFTANQSGNSTVNIEIPTTDIQTAVDEFETYNGGLLSSLKVALSPNQDLHGYSEPWVGGAGKNKFDDALIVNPSATAQWIQVTLKPNTNYTVTSNIPYYSSSAYIFAVSGTDTSSATSATDGVGLNTPRTVTADNNGIISFAYRNNGGGGVLDLTQYHYQIEEGSTATAYEPYENICPISGHTQVDVWNHQKNLCDDSLIVQGDIDNSTGADTADGSLKHIRSGYCNAESSTQYTVSHNHTIGSGTLKVFEYRSDKSFIRRTNAGAVTSLSYTFTTHSECKYIRIAIYDENGISKDSTWIQLELGSTATAYVPYNGYQVTVNLGGTYYSGTLDVVSGVFTATHVMWSDDGSKNWARNADGSFYVFYTDTHPLAVQDAEGCACDYAPFALSFVGMNVFARANGIVSLGRGWGDIYPDVASLKAQFAIEPFQMVYKLATPTPIQLIPTPAKALVGENHLSAPLDGQEIVESKYKQIFTFDDVIAYIQSLS